MNSPRQPLPRSTWRLLDTGPAGAAVNIALDAAQLELRATEKIPNTVRFLQYLPAAVLIGCNQTLEQEVRTAYCRERGIDINRRITGGGAIYFDSTQLGWEIIASRRSLAAGPTMADLTECICNAAVLGLRRLGLKAYFRPRNDIEVNGKKISGTGGAWEGGAFLFQGTLLIDFDLETMVRALRTPAEKLARHELDSARSRVTSLAAELSYLPPLDDIKKALAAGFREAFQIDLSQSGLAVCEEVLAAELLSRYASYAWIDEVREPAADHQIMNSIHGGAGGLIRTSASLDLRRRRIKSVLFSGDYFVRPRHAIFGLETHLKDSSFDLMESRIDEFFTTNRPELLGLGAMDFQQGLRSCLDKAAYPRLGIPPEDANYISTVNTADLEESLRETSVLLLPYCAKPPECEYRNTDGCEECGDCSVGEAYALAREKGMLPVSICDYKHLENVFAACHRAGVISYIGCCCRAFLARRHQLFTAAGMSGVLIDIEDTTCYELEHEEDAYAGRFERQTRLKIDLLEKILRNVPERQSPPELEIPAPTPAPSPAPSPVVPPRSLKAWK